MFERFENPRVQTRNNGDIMRVLLNGGDTQILFSGDLVSTVVGFGALRCKLYYDPQECRLGFEFSVDGTGDWACSRWGNVFIYKMNITKLVQAYGIEAKFKPNETYTVQRENAIIFVQLPKEG